MTNLGKFSIGVGDRFAHQAKAQLQACIRASNAGVDVIPVWNKSNREHTLIGTEPLSVRVAADAAVGELGWKLPYFCDADHINLSTVERFLPSCDFYTIDVADYIGKSAESASVDRFVSRHPELLGSVSVGAGNQAIEVTPELLRNTAAKFLPAIQEAGKIYRHIESAKGAGTFITEVSMDETNTAQTPAELLIIFAAIADESIPIQTIAPKFSGRFNKGVDYVGDPAQFAHEMALDIIAIQHAVETYGLPTNLKLSVHSGSDKFSIYPVIHSTIKQFSAGVHLKTAGTTWLEEVIGLAEAGGDGLALAKEIYAEAFAHSKELCAPYATVIEIDPARLPAPAEVAHWSSAQFTSALRHNPCSASYNPSFRQLLHVGFKVAANMGDRYLDLIDSNRDIIAKNVTENLFVRHIAPVFLGDPVTWPYQTLAP
jgi:tagaturonate epimerase